MEVASSQGIRAPARQPIRQPSIAICQALGDPDWLIRRVLSEDFAWGSCVYSAAATAPTPTRRGMFSPTTAITALTPVNTASPYSPPE